tara:strand:- start:444 stop:881 length:438 start_codon:yes stop_codon:yes gene_type:complete
MQHITQIKTKMVLKRNTLVGKNNSKLFFLVFLFYFLLIFNSHSKNNLEGSFTDIKILDKISSKNILLKLKNGELMKFKDLAIKSLKCKNSEFDDDPEITAYIQVKDLTNKKNDEVFVFNGWMFSSSPSIAPFDHPVYDVWLVSCY